jgi:hypothetical protein
MRIAMGSRFGKRRLAFVLAASIVVVTVLVIGLFTLSLNWGPSADTAGSLVPEDWHQTSRSGHISKLCSGAWEECGSISIAYSTEVDAEHAVEGVTAHLAAMGWTVTRDSPLGAGTRPDVRLTAVNDSRDWDKIAYFTISDNTASVTYVEH